MWGNRLTRQPAKLGVAGSKPAIASTFKCARKADRIQQEDCKSSPFGGVVRVHSVTPLCAINKLGL